jgi:hypothetical protein
MKITITLPPPQVVTRALASEWGPALQQGAKALAAVLVAVYTAGLVAGIRWQQLLALLEQCLQQGMARFGVPGAPLEPFMAPTIDLPRPPVRIQRQAPAVLPVIGRRDACRRLQAQGLSPAKIGRELGISRSTVRRELAS